MGEGRMNYKWGRGLLTLLADLKVDIADNILDGIDDLLEDVALFKFRFEHFFVFESKF